MIAFLVIFSILSLALNVVLGYYSYKAARTMMDISEEISIFWASLIEYKDYLDSLTDMHLYQNNSKIRGFVESTKKTIKEIQRFREFCSISGILSEEEMNLLQDMEEDYKKHRDQLSKGPAEDEHIKEWDKERKRKIEKQGQPKPTPRT